ncbi:DapH/DapD/GlmU-related protein [Mahella australiensis]|nr:DapH/DapD/GlmU-related protein [Mahella australiensis]
MMIRENINGHYPQIDHTAYIDPTAVIVGNVHIGKRVYVGPNVVIRADELTDIYTVGSITIGDDCNIQDGVIIHTLGDACVTIGSRTSLGHGCVIHAPCNIGAHCFIGYRSVISNADIGDWCYVGISVVAEGIKVEKRRVVPTGAILSYQQQNADLLPVIDKQRCDYMERVIDSNIKLTNGYNAINC